MPVWTLVRSSREGASNPRSGPGLVDEPRHRSDSASTKLLGGFRLPSARGLLVLRAEP